MGFRVGRPPEEGLNARQLFPLQLMPCAAPSYLVAHGAPKTIDELATHRCSMFRHPGTDVRYFGLTPGGYGSIAVTAIGAWILWKQHKVPPVVVWAGNPTGGPVPPAPSDPVP